MLLILVVLGLLVSFITRTKMMGSMKWSTGCVTRMPVIVWHEGMATVNVNCINSSQCWHSCDILVHKGHRLFNIKFNTGDTQLVQCSLTQLKKKSKQSKGHELYSLLTSPQDSPKKHQTDFNNHKADICPSFHMKSYYKISWLVLEETATLHMTQSSKVGE